MKARREVGLEFPDVRSAMLAFPAWLSGLSFVSAVELLRQRGAPAPSWELRLDLRLVRPWTLILLVEQKGEDELACSLIEGPFSAVEGTLAVRAGERGEGSILEIELHLQPGFYVPLPLLRSLEVVELPVLLQAVEGHARGWVGAAQTG